MSSKVTTRDFYAAVTVLQRFVCAFEEGRLMRPALSASLPHLASPTEKLALDGLLFDLGLRLDRRHELTRLSRKSGLAEAIETLARQRLRERHDQPHASGSTAGALIKDIALDHGYSRDTLRRRIARTTGMAPREWRQRQRIGRAIELIREGMKVESAGLECGYRSQRAFFAAFKKLTGMTPSAVRQLSPDGAGALRSRLLPWESPPQTASRDVSGVKSRLERSRSV